MPKYFSELFIFSFSISYRDRILIFCNITERGIRINHAFSSDIRIFVDFTPIYITYLNIPSKPFIYFLFLNIASRQSICFFLNNRIFPGSHYLFSRCLYIDFETFLWIVEIIKFMFKLYVYLFFVKYLIVTRRHIYLYKISGVMLDLFVRIRYLSIT